MTIKYTGLTVRSSRYMVFDKKSMPIVACKTITALKHFLLVQYLIMHEVSIQEMLFPPQNILCISVFSTSEAKISNNK